MLLEKELNELLNKPKSGDISQKIGKIQEELGAVHNRLVTGAKICSKEKFYHDDENPQNIFSILRTIDKIRSESLSSLTSEG